MTAILTQINAAQNMDVTDLSINMCPIDPLVYTLSPEIIPMALTAITKSCQITTTNPDGTVSTGMPKCPIGQNLQIKALSEQVVKNITTNENVQKALKELDNYAKTTNTAIAQGVGDALGDVFRGAGEGVGTVAKDVGTGLSTTATGIGTGLSTTATGLGSGVSNAATGLGSGVGTAAEGVGTGFGSIFSGMGTGVWIFIFMLIAAAVALYYFTTKE